MVVDRQKEEGCKIYMSKVDTPKGKLVRNLERIFLEIQNMMHC